MKTNVKRPLFCAFVSLGSYCQVLLLYTVLFCLNRINLRGCINKVVAMPWVIFGIYTSILVLSSPPTIVTASFPSYVLLDDVVETRDRKCSSKRRTWRSIRTAPVCVDSSRPSAGTKDFLTRVRRDYVYILTCYVGAGSRRMHIEIVGDFAFRATIQKTLHYRWYPANVHRFTIDCDILLSLNRDLPFNGWGYSPTISNNLRYKYKQHIQNYLAKSFHMHVLLKGRMTIFRVYVYTECVCVHPTTDHFLLDYYYYYHHHQRNQTKRNAHS